jgi:hypothetical protein
MEAKAFPADKAAAYVGCRSVRHLRSEVAQGIWPPPIAPRSRPERWSVLQLDKALLGEQGEAVGDEDPFLKELHRHRD